MKQIEVRPYQIPHFRRILKILSKEYGYLDVSPLGAGKTHITFAIGATYRLSMLIVCPKSTVPNWQYWAEEYGMPCRCITYESLRGQNGIVNHDLLECLDGEYIATDVFSQYVQAGVLLVFDEYQKVKNENTQLASAHALVKELIRLVRMGYKSRIALLSGTPCEMDDKVTSTFKMLGIMLSDKLYDYNRSNKSYELVGIQEVIDKANEYNPEETLLISCKSVNKTTAKTMCYDLYTRVLKEHIVTSMPPPPINVEKDAKNLYVLMLPEEVERLKRGILLFKNATNYNPNDMEVNLGKVNWGNMTKSRMEIDSAKIPATCRNAISNLECDANCKIIIYCNYKRDMKYAQKVLEKYNPLIMDGSTTAKYRKDTINKFQKDDNEYRVMISIPKVGGIGIELDDKFGTRPRIEYILPSYFFTDQYQCTGRIHRDGTKSKATIRFVYSRNFPYETGILNSMAKKSKVVRNMVTEEHNSIVFPGEYQEILELTTEEQSSGIIHDFTLQSDEKISEIVIPEVDDDQEIIEIMEEKEEIVSMF